MSKSRRKFLNIIIGGGVVGWLAAVFYPVISFLKPPPVAEANVSSLKVGAVGAFAPGSSQIVKFGRQPVILIRLDSGEFRGFAATCTHLDCTVQYRSEKKDIWCACHNGVYDLMGRNVSGPPPRPLEEFTVGVVEGDVVVSRGQA